MSATRETAGVLVWHFAMPSPCHIRSIATVNVLEDDLSNGFDESLLSAPEIAPPSRVVPLPHCLVIDRKVGHVTAYNLQLTQELSAPLTPAAAGVVDQKSKKVAPTVATLAVCVYVSETNGNVWVGWSSGVITVNALCAPPENAKRKDDSVRSAAGRTPRTRTPSPVSSLASGRGFNPALARWSHKVTLSAHRSAVTHIVGGFGPWVFSGGRDGVIAQWDVRTHANVRCIQSESSKPVKTICLALGCSTSRELVNSKGHLILFYALEKEPLRVAAVMPASPTGRGDASTRSCTSPRPLRFSSSSSCAASCLLLSRRGNEDAAAVLSIGSEDGHLRLIPLTILRDSHPMEQLSTADYLEELERVPVDAAPTLQVRKGWRVSQQGLLHVATEAESGGASYVIAVATSNPTVSIVRVDVATLVDGGRVLSSHLLYTCSTAHSVTSIQPLLHPSVGPSPIALGCVTLSSGQAEFLAASYTTNAVSSNMPRARVYGDARAEAIELLMGSGTTQLARHDSEQKNSRRGGSPIGTTSSSSVSYRDVHSKGHDSNNNRSSSRTRSSTTDTGDGGGAVSHARFEAVLRQVAHAQKLASDAVAALRVQDEEIKESRAERDALRKQTDLLRAMLAQRDGGMMSRSATAAASTSTMQGSWIGMTDDMHSLAEENARLREDIAIASRKMAEIKGVWNKKEDDYQLLIQNLEKQILEFSANDRQVNNLKVQVDRKTAENARLASQLMSLEKQLANTEAALGLLRKTEREQARQGSAHKVVAIRPRDLNGTPQRFASNASQNCSIHSSFSQHTNEEGHSSTHGKRVPAPASMNTFRRALQRLDSEPVSTPR